MGNTYVISGLRDKRARIAGEIIQAQEVVARRTKELLALDAVIRLFSPDTDPDMIAPIRPTSHGLFFQYRELGRLCLDALRKAGKPVTLEWIADIVMATKGLPDDKRLRRHVMDSARQSLMRMALKGRARRILDEPEVWWELVGPDIPLAKSTPIW
jgi:hypothetical protein